MPKRKDKDTEDDIRRKIAKYEKRLAKCTESSAQSPELDPEVLDTPEIHNDSMADMDGIQEHEENVDEAQEPDTDIIGEGQEPKTDTGEAQDLVPELDSEFLSALGESSGGIRQYGDEIHKEIFNTFGKILLEGISKQNKEKLLETLLIPSNCRLLDAPKLNTELVGVLNNPARVRDKLMEDRQQELGLAMGGICSVINSMSKRDFNKYNVIKKLTDVSRILCHLHYQYTEIRRKLVNPFLDKNLVESLKDNKREDFLYSHLDTSVKSYSAMKRAANIIKPKPAHTVENPHTSKNFHQTPRRLHPANQLHQGRGSYRGAHRYNTPRQPFRPLDNRTMGPPMRGRAKYP